MDELPSNTDVYIISLLGLITDKLIEKDILTKEELEKFVKNSSKIAYE